jgi:thioredoxin reductase
MLAIGREQLRPYVSVEIRDLRVLAVKSDGLHFRVTLIDGTELSARKILLATGVVDAIPEVEGIRELYGKSVFHCPYCDGWEVRDQALAVYGRGSAGIGLARALRNWSEDVVLCTDGPERWTGRDQQRLARLGIPVRTAKIVRVEGAAGRLERIVFADGESLPRRALFFHIGQGQRSDLAVQLGCRLTSSGSVQCDDNGRTSVSGVYVAGDASRDVQLAIIAAAEGTRAAFAINKEFLQEDR